MAKESSKKTIICLICTFVYGVSSVTAAITAATNGEVTLKVEMGGQIDEVLWKHKGHKMVEWDNPAADPVEYLSFKERTVLDKTTGDVTIRLLTKADSGLYEAEVVVQGKLISKSHTVEVYDPVTDAKINCNSSGSMATLHCEAKGDSLSYSWHGDGLQSTEIQGQTGPQISKEKDQNSVYTCVVSNPVTSISVNYHAKDCFSSDAANVWPIVGGVVGVVVLLACCFAGYKWRTWKQQRSSSLSELSTKVKEPLLKDPSARSPKAQHQLKFHPPDMTSGDTPAKKGVVQKAKEAIEKGEFGKSGSNEESESPHGEQIVEKEGGDRSTPPPEAQHTPDHTPNTANNTVSYDKRWSGMSGNADDALKNTHGEKDMEMEGGERSGEVNEDTAHPSETEHIDNSPNTADNMVPSEVKHDPSKHTDINNDFNSKTVSSPTPSHDEQKTTGNLGSSNSVAGDENHSDTKASHLLPIKTDVNQPSSDSKKNSDLDCTDRVSPPDQPPDGQRTEERLLGKAADTQQQTTDESSDVDAESAKETPDPIVLIEQGVVKKRKEAIERGEFRMARFDEASESAETEGEEGSGEIYPNTSAAPLDAHYTPDNSLNAGNNGLTDKAEVEHESDTGHDSIDETVIPPAHSHDKQKSEGEKTEGEENRSDNE